jgi:hypothetical protein
MRLALSYASDYDGDTFERRSDRCGIVDVDLPRSHLRIAGRISSRNDDAPRVPVVEDRRDSAAHYAVPADDEYVAGRHASAPIWNALPL